jgi:ATP-dependent Clp endopeptidase proteolytic subunit ClpP
MFKLEKQVNKAILTIYGYVGGNYLDFRAVNNALEDITKLGYSNLDFHIHTYGGSVFDGNLIYNFLASFKGDVDVYIDGVAASMGSIIIMAGKRIHIAENGFIMIHTPQGGVEGTAKQMSQYAKLLTSMENNFKEKLIQRTGKTENEVNAWFDGTDYWFDSNEALSIGLVDSKFNAKAQNIDNPKKSELRQIGAKALYDRFAASFVTPNLSNSTDDKIGWRWHDYQEKAISELEAMPQTDPEKFKCLYLAEFGVYPEGIRPKSQAIETPNNEDRSGWTWHDYQEKAISDLEAMLKTDLKKFNALYFAEFGVYPEIK